MIGPRSNIQDNAAILIDHNSSTIRWRAGHGRSLCDRSSHACTVDDEVLIGMGAIIHDGAEIGVRSIIGANALVTLGKKISPGALVLGSPVKIKRSLTLKERKDIARWAWSYVGTAKHFREFYKNCSGAL